MGTEGRHVTALVTYSHLRLLPRQKVTAENSHGREGCGKAEVADEPES